MEEGKGLMIRRRGRAFKMGEGEGKGLMIWGRERGF